MAIKGSFYRKAIIFCISKLFRKKIILQIHAGIFYDYYKNSKYNRMIKWVLSNADAVLFLYKTQRDDVSGAIPLKKGLLLNNIVPNRDYRTVVAKEKIKLLFLGRLTDRKGVFDLMEVLARNNKKWDGKIEVDICGLGDQNRLFNMIKKFSLESVVKYSGWVDGVEKENKLSDSHLLILPSYAEAMPISVLEAMSFGLPIIATNVGSVPSMVTSYSNGFLTEPGDLDAIETAINYYIDNKNKIGEHGKASFESAEEFFPESVGAKLRDIYQNL